MAKKVKKRVKATTGATHVGAGEFKARCLALMDRVRERGDVRDHQARTPVARLMPVEDETTVRSPFGWMKGTVRVHGDIISPIDVEWDAASDE